MGEKADMLEPIFAAIRAVTFEIALLLLVIALTIWQWPALSDAQKFLGAFAIGGWLLAALNGFLASMTSQHRTILQLLLRKDRDHG